MTDKLPDTQPTNSSDQALPEAPAVPAQNAAAQGVPAADSTATPALSRPFSRSALYALAGEQKLDAATLEGALRLLGVRPDAQGWARYWFHLFCLCGALFLASGIICFIAWNWKGFSPFAKFGVLEGLIACAALFAVWRGLSSAAGSAALTAAGLCIGPLLAVFGQTYMSGAHMWELYRAWACMLLPLALAGGQSGLWLLTWLVASLWGLGYMESMGENHWISYGFPEFFLLQIAALCILEICMYRAQNSTVAGQSARPKADWLQSCWLPRLMGFAIIGLVTFVLSIVMLETYYLDPDNVESLLLPFMPSTAIIHGAGLVALYFWYRYKRPDLFMLCCGLFSLCTLLVVALLTHVSIDTDTLFFLGLFVIGLTALCGKVLLYLQRSMEAEQCAKAKRSATNADSAVQENRHAGWKNSATRPFCFELPVPDWFSFQDLLQTNGLWPKDKAFPQPPPAGAPWYINTMLGVGGWLSALLLILLAVFLLYDLLRKYGWSIDNICLPVGALLILAGALCSRLPGMYARQFGLASAIAGGVLATSSVILPGDCLYWPFPCLLVCLMGFAGVRNATLRFIAAGACVFFAYYLLDILVWNRPDYNLFHHGRSFDMDSYGTAISRSSVMAPLWLALFGLQAFGWHRQSLWLARKGCTQIMEPLLYGIYACLLLMPVLAKLVPFLFGPIPFLLSPHAGLGLSAAAGCLFLVYLLGNRPLAGLAPNQQAEPASARNPGLYRASLAAALLIFPLGWYLPGAAIALFGFLVSRHIGSAVLFGGTSLYLGAYIIQYYYDLNDTLLQKSYSLAACGLVFLGIAVCIQRFFSRGKDYPAFGNAAPLGRTRSRAVALAAVLALSFGLFHWTAMQKEALRNGGTTMYLRLAPVDPRAFLLGDYMALNYALDSEVADALRKSGQNDADKKDGLIVVRISKQGEASFVRLDDKTPLAEGEHLLYYRQKNRQTEVAAHAFFFQEGQAADYEKAAYGEIHADANGKTLLTHLLDKNMQRIEP